MVRKEDDPPCFAQGKKLTQRVADLFFSPGLPCREGQQVLEKKALEPNSSEKDLHSDPVVGRRASGKPRSTSSNIKASVDLWSKWELASEWNIVRRRLVYGEYSYEGHLASRDPGGV